MSNLIPTQMLGDDQLVKLAKAGDEKAFSAIYKRYGHDLHRYCMGILGNADEASDALQNAMIKAFRALQGEEREVELKPWLYRICHNESVSIIRQRPPVQELRDEMASIALSPAQRVEDVIRVKQLLCDLSNLPERQRGALVMRELSGLSYDEIGECLGSSAAAAKQCVFEARSALHQCEDGRSLDCRDVREVISASDKRMLRGRKLKAHLSQCAGCRAFQMSINERCGAFALLAPPVPAAMAIMKLLGAESDSGHEHMGEGIARAATSGGVAGQASGISSALSQLGTVSTALKSTAVVAAAVSIGIGPIASSGSDKTEGPGGDTPVVDGSSGGASETSAAAGSAGPSGNQGPGSTPGGKPGNPNPGGGDSKPGGDGGEGNTGAGTETGGVGNGGSGSGSGGGTGSDNGDAGTPGGTPGGSDSGVTDPPPRSDNDDQIPELPPTDPEPEPEPEPEPDPAETGTGE